LLGAFVDPSTFLLVTACAAILLGALCLPGSTARWDAGSGEVALAAVLVLDGLPVLGIRALGLLGLLAGTSRPVARAVRRSLGARPRRDRRRWWPRRARPAQAPPTYVEACLCSMTGKELCTAWRASFVGVKSESLRERRLEAGLRKSLLDELERRDADRFRAWLARAPSAASAPLWAASLPSLAPAPRTGRPR
jgi:hypothetical protein